MILGKNVGSDIENHKSTYVSLMGIEKSQEIIEQYFNEVDELINKLKINHEVILEIIKKIKRRVK